MTTVRYCGSTTAHSPHTVDRGPWGRGWCNGLPEWERELLLHGPAADAAEPATPPAEPSGAAPAAAGPHPPPDDQLCADPDCGCCYPGGLEEAYPTGEEVLRYAVLAAGITPAAHRAVAQAVIHGMLQDGWHRPAAGRVLDAARQWRAATVAFGQGDVIVAERELAAAVDALDGDQPAEPSKHATSGPENRTYQDSGGSSPSSAPEPAPEPAPDDLSGPWCCDTCRRVAEAGAPEPDSGPGFHREAVESMIWHGERGNTRMGGWHVRQIADQLRALLADRDRRISPERYKAAMDDLARVAARADQELDAARAELARLRDRQADSIDPATIPDQRAKNWADFHPEAYCHRCGRPNVSWYADSAIWNEVHGGSGPIWCPVCFVKAYEQKTGSRISWRLAPADKSDELSELIQSEAAMRHQLAEAAADRDRLRAELDDWQHNLALRAFTAPDADLDTMLASLDSRIRDARRDAAADTLAWLGDGCGGVPLDTARCRQLAAEVRRGRRPVPGSPQPASEGDQDG